ncbi:MAG: SDR family NAD(P)-dependent oxidoreductase [Candidatus Pelagibacterales bacterium]|nr:MAG: SDR family NAD(P)-dependent oxidoreductase [Pelagibacterales bacterium]
MIKNSNIVITGTSSGIGKELTLKFLKNGNKVWGCSRKKDSIAIKNYFHYKVDLSDPSKIEEWVYKVSEDTDGKIDIFVSNAAAFERKLNSLDSFKNIKNTIDINLTAPILITNMISKFMIQNKKGLIIYFSSVAAIINEIGTSVYSSSKSGLETFSKTLNQELNKFNIKIASLRILHVPSKLSNKLNSQEIINLKNKFKTNKFGTIDKIFNKINKLYFLKKISKNNLFCDELKKK